MKFERRQLLPPDDFITKYTKKKLNDKETELKEILYALSDWNNPLLGGNLVFRHQTYTKVVNWLITEKLDKFNKKYEKFHR